MKRKKPEPAFCWVYTVCTGESLQSIAGRFLGSKKRCGENPAAKWLEKRYDKAWAGA